MNLIKNIIALIKLIAYFISTILIFTTIAITSIFRIPPKYIRSMGWFLYKLCFNLTIKTEGKLVKKRPLLVIANHTSFIEMCLFGNSINPAFVPKAELRKMPFMGFIMEKGGCLFIDRNPRKAKEGTANLAKKLNSEKSPLLIFPEGTTNNGNEIKPFKSAMFSIVEHQLGKNDIPEKEKIYIQPAVYYFKHSNKKKSTAKEREFYAYYIKPNPEDDESFLKYIFKIFKHGKIHAHLKYLDPIELSQFKDRKELAAHCQKIVSNEYQKLIKQ